MKALALLYGLVAYLMFLAVFFYTILFTGGLWVPITVDTPSQLGAGAAVAVDLVLLGLFGAQHSGMARHSFKTSWTKLVPWPIERSTYVIFSNLVLALLLWQWQGVPHVVWNVQQGPARIILWVLFGAGWLTVLLSTFMISHADLFGLRQVWDLVKGRVATPLGFQTHSLYKLVRHPLMAGFIIAFWAAPRMTAGHLLFAAAATGYILAALQLEERDLVRIFGDSYRDYCQRVPMLAPLRFGRRPHSGGLEEEDV